MLPDIVYYGMERELTSKYQVIALGPCYSECGLRTGSVDITQALLRNAGSLAQLPSLQNEDGISSFHPHKSKVERK